MFDQDLTSARLEKCPQEFCGSEASSEKKMMTQKLKHRGLAVALAAAALFGTQAASADTIKLTGFWGGAGNATITFSGKDYHDGVTYPSFTETGGAGGFATTDLTTGGPSFQSWCVDIFHNFNFPVTTVDTKQNASQIFSQLGATAAAKIEKNLDRLYAAEHTLIDPHLSTADNSAAFQLAVWEIVNEKSTNSYNLTTGDLTITSGSAGFATAQTWLGLLNTDSSNPLYTVSFWNVNDVGGAPKALGAQDVAVFAPIPEPETYAMLLAGLGLMGFIARRRRGRDAA